MFLELSCFSCTVDGDYFLKNSHLWDDRAEGMGTPYPEAKRNNGTAPGPSYNDNIARHIEGDKPAVIEKVTGLESSVPPVIELSSSESEEIILDPEPQIDPDEDLYMIVMVAAIVFVAVSAVVTVILLKKKKKRKALPQEAQCAENKAVSRDDSYDSYDGFDI